MGRYGANISATNNAADIFLYASVNFFNTTIVGSEGEGTTMQDGSTILDLRILLSSEINHIVNLIILFIQFRGTSKVRKHVK